MLFCKNGLNFPKAPLPLQDVVLEGRWWLSPLSYPSISFDYRERALAQHLARRGAFWKARQPVVNHAFLKFKELTSPGEYASLVRHDTSEADSAPLPPSLNRQLLPEPTHDKQQGQLDPSRKFRKCPRARTRHICDFPSLLWKL